MSASKFPNFLRSPQNLTHSSVAVRNDTSGFDESRFPGNNFPMGKKIHYKYN